MLKKLQTSIFLKEDRFFSRWAAISLGLHLLAVIFSTGFYHADEHFQIVEFTYLKIRELSGSGLLEYNYQLRPWLFPGILYLLTKGLQAFGIDSPFHWALYYRLFSASIGWISSLSLGLCAQKWFPGPLNRKKREIAIILGSLLWFIPAFHARPSSENLSGSFIFLGLSTLVLFYPERSRPRLREKSALMISFIAGLLFGLAFEFRFQTGFMILGAVLWFALQGKSRARDLFGLMAGILLITAIGVGIDHWGYGKWTFSPWNYLQYNLIQNHVSDSEVSPLWDYFRRAITESWPGLGILLLLSFVVSWFRYPLHPLTWTVLPFFLVHSLIGHKELRFLFPILNCAGIVLILAWESVARYRFLKRTLPFLFVFNLIALLVTTLTPAWMPIGFYSYLDFLSQTGAAPKTLYYYHDSLFNRGGAHIHFYRPTEIAFLPAPAPQELAAWLKNGHPPFWIMHPQASLQDILVQVDESDRRLIEQFCMNQYQTLPHWTQEPSFAKFTSRMTNWTLFKCAR